MLNTDNFSISSGKHHPGHKRIDSVTFSVLQCGKRMWRPISRCVHVPNQKYQETTMGLYA